MKMESALKEAKKILKRAQEVQGSRSRAQKLLLTNRTRIVLKTVHQGKVKVNCNTPGTTAENLEVSLVTRVIPA
jgi:hypothetical protein